MLGSEAEPLWQCVIQKNVPCRNHAALLKGSAGYHRCSESTTTWKLKMPQECQFFHAARFSMLFVYPNPGNIEARPLCPFLKYSIHYRVFRYFNFECAYVCLCVSCTYVYMCLHAWGHICILRGRYQESFLMEDLIEAGLLSKSRAQWYGCSYWATHSEITGTLHFVGYEDPHSGSHACMARALTTEQHPFLGLH